MQIVKGIRAFPGPGFESNMYLIDGEILVDTGLGGFFPEVKSEIINLGLDPRDIHTIVLTHHHHDHTGGVKKFRDWLKAAGSEAVVAVHSADRGRLEHGDTLAELFEQTARTITADIGLSDGDVLETETKRKLKIIHTPGHTPGSICLYDKKARALLSGDTLFRDGFGRTDYPGGSAEHMAASLRQLSKLDVEYLLPGHGEPKVGASSIRFLIKQILGSPPKPAKHK